MSFRNVTAFSNFLQVDVLSLFTDLALDPRERSYFDERSQ